MRGLRTFIGPVAITAGLAIGCSQSTSPNTTTAESKTVMTTAASEKQPELARSLENVTLKPVTTAEFENSIRENKGRVVLVDAWFLG